MEIINLEVSLRKEVGKNKVKSLRKQGFIPCVIYGNSKEPVTISVNAKKLEKIYKEKYGSNVILKLNITDGDKTKLEEEVISYEIERDTIMRHLTHISFLRIDNKKPLSTEVPVILEGTAPGVKLGGTLLHKHRWLKIECLPKDIPENIAIAISELEIGDQITVGDLPKTEKYKILHQDREGIVQVIAPRGKTLEEEEEELAAAEAAATGEGEEEKGEAKPSAAESGPEAASSKANE